MVQTIYGLLAIALVMLLSLNFMRTITGSQQKMILNEVATQVTGIGVDVMEHLGNKSFDEATDEAGVEPADFPLVTSAAMLTPASGFGTNGDGATCDHATPDFYDNDCNDIDDFDGMTLARNVDGIPYTAEIEVRYVQENNPSQAAGAQTYAKEVVVTISSPYLLLGGAPIEVTLRRVFAYNRITA